MNEVPCATAYLLVARRLAGGSIVARFNFQRFLSETGVSLARLAAYLRVAQSYLEAAAAGRGRLTTRDQAACRLLWRRLTQAVQLELPFAEAPETFTRRHARLLARARSSARGALPKKPVMAEGHLGKPSEGKTRRSAAAKNAVAGRPRPSRRTSSRSGRRPQP